MAHGYLREYDEAPDRGSDRDRGRDEERSRGWRGSDQRSDGWRDSDHDANERNRNFMLGGSDRSSDRDYSRDYSGERARSRFRNVDRQYRMTHEDEWDTPERASSRYGQDRSGFAGGWAPERNFGSSQDDHYRSWRDRQMAALDRDYADYCRECEQQFHRDFDDWRRNRRQGRERTGEAIAAESELELTHERALAGQGNTPSPVGEATLGTNNSENTGVGRAKPTP